MQTTTKSKPTARNSTIPAYVLAWQSPIMRAPAFWYFRSRDLAETWRADMARRGYTVRAIEPRTIPAEKAGILLLGEA
jgi:hypothetical protein